MDPGHNPPALVRLAQIEVYPTQHVAQMEAMSVQLKQAAFALEGARAAFVNNHRTVAWPNIPASLPAAAAPPAVRSDCPEPRVGTPERVAGGPASCGAFITNCSLLFSLHQS